MGVSRLGRQLVGELQFGGKKVKKKRKKSRSVTEATGSLVKSLHKVTAGYDKPRSLKRTHASDVTKPDFCPRRVALLLVTGKPQRSEFLTAARQLVYRQGNGIANAVIHWLADDKMAIGDWECIACKEFYPHQLRPTKCARCNFSSMKYKEMRVEGLGTGISCGIDLAQPKGSGLVQIVEIKTMDKDEFKKLVMPLAEHRLRTKLYVRQFKDSNHPLASGIHQTAKLLYISKGGYGQDQREYLKSLGINEQFSPYKEYEFDVDLGDEEGEVLRCEAEAIKLKKFRDSGILPDGPCPTAFCKQAQKCEVMGECFSGKYPPGGEV